MNSDKENIKAVSRRILRKNERMRHKESLSPQEIKKEKVQPSLIDTMYGPHYRDTRDNRGTEEENVKIEKDIKDNKPVVKESKLERTERKIKEAQWQKKVQEEIIKEAERKKKEREEQIAHAKGEDIVYKHIEVLRRKRLQKIIKDDYGNVDDSNWEKEKEYFFHNVMEKDETRIFQYSKTRYVIDEILDEYDENASSIYSENMSPYDYEHYCASLLKESGWDAQATQGSGDQGVDVVATKNGNRIAIQCKKYSSPVGNKAVQEVFSAKAHVGADHAIVVTNHSYTKSAKELASSTGVLLLHHDELKNLPF